VINTSGSSRSRRNVQTARAESLPPLQDRAKDVCRGSPVGAVLSPGRCDRRGRDWIVCPLMKNLRVGGGRGPAAAAARTALPPRAGVRSAQSGRPGLSPTRGASQLRDSAGFAPDFAVSTPAGDMCPATRAYVITPTAVTALLTCERWIAVVGRITTSKHGELSSPAPHQRCEGGRDEHRVESPDSSLARVRRAGCFVLHDDRRSHDRQCCVADDWPRPPLLRVEPAWA